MKHKLQHRFDSSKKWKTIGDWEVDENGRTKSGIDVVRKLEFFEEAERLEGEIRVIESEPRVVLQRFTTTSKKIGLFTS